MTKSEASTPVEQSQEPTSAVDTATETAATAQEASKPLSAGELAALAAAASADVAPQSEEAAVEFATAPEPQANVKAKAVVEQDEKDKEGEDEADAQAPVDLAMASEADIFEAITAADGAREAPAEEGEASALTGDNGGAPILAVAAAVAVGAGIYFLVDNDDDEVDLPDVNVAPVFTSEESVDVAENIDVGEVVYTAAATDADGDDITYSILASSADADAFTINAETGELLFVASPDFETQDSYTVTLVATDSEGNAVEQEVVINVTDVAENVAPVFTSEESVDVAENIDVGEVVYTAAATDADGDDITYSILASSADADAFTINAETGELLFVASPDFETQDSYAVTLVATDSEGNAVEQEVVINVTDVVDENAAPVITSSGAVAVDENIGVDTVILDVSATDAEGDAITYSLAGDDAGSFEIDPATGEVRFVASPDFEMQETYNLTVIATDAMGNASDQEVVVTVGDLDETVVDLDAIDSDGNPLTPYLIDAGAGDVVFFDDAAEASNSLILNFAEGDQIQFSEGAEVSFTTGADDANDLEITVNNDGIVSVIVLDDVLADDAGFIFDEATAEAAVGFDFLSVGDVMPATAVAEEIFG